MGSSAQAASIVPAVSNALEGRYLFWFLRIFMGQSHPNLTF
jgi:hypothetical protein